MKAKILKIVLPLLLDSYVAVIDKKVNDGKFEHPKGWIISRDYCIKLSNLIKLN